MGPLGGTTYIQKKGFQGTGGGVAGGFSPNKYWSGAQLQKNQIKSGKFATNNVVNVY